MENVAVLALALLLDLLLGEPPNRFHPVAWLGKLISLQEKLSPRSGATAQFFYGVMVVIADVALFSVPIYLLMHYLGKASPIAYVLAGGLLLKIAFSIRALRSSALQVKAQLDSNRIDDARSQLRSLVSRDTGPLDKPQLVSAAIESVAENTCDSIVAPIFYFLIFGIPGALAYRVVNTLDAMIGYHGEYEYFGKTAARLDDVLNYIPARLAALLIVAAAFVEKRGRNAWRILRRDHGQTESPNAGWPMSAMAGALGVCLEKPGFYRLGGEEGQLTTRKINACLTLTTLTVALWAVICLATEWVRFVYFS